MIVEGSTQDKKFIKRTIQHNLKRPLLAKLNYGANRKKGRNVPVRQPVQHEENEAIENDELETMGMSLRPEVDDTSFNSLSSEFRRLSPS